MTKLGTLLNLKNLRNKLMTEVRTHNTGLAKEAVKCSADTFVVNQTLVLCIHICVKNRHLRQARNRYAIQGRP